MNRGVALAVCAFAALVVARAQEIDTALTLSAPRKTTLLDQIEDRSERRDFLKLYQTKDAAKKHNLAEQFISAYPQSWFLAEAFEAAAKASIDLGHLDRAITEAQLCLRLFPENSLLLVPLSNVEAQIGRLDSAEQDALRSLEFLKEFAPPLSNEAGAEPQLKPQLEASARFALARVYTNRALRQQGSIRATWFNRAFEQLNLALAANKDDAEIWLLRGMVQQALGSNLAAASDFAQASEFDSPVHATALDRLKQIYSSSPGATANSFDVFLHNLPPPHLESTQPAALPSSQLGNYAGSAACRECHRSEYDSWKQTGMARMLRPYSRENVFGDFHAGVEFRGDSGSPIARMGFDSRPYMDLRSSDGSWQRFHVAYTIGSKWQQAYVVETSGGRLQVLPIQYNKLEGRWLNYWKLIDPPGSMRADPLQFAQLSGDTSYQINCAICHTSQLKANSSDPVSIERARFREPGINCEMCHGPSQNHVDRMHGVGAKTQETSSLPVHFANIANRKGVAICAQCHRQSALRGPTSRGELNYSSDGATFVQQTVSRPYPEFLRRAFYKDGRFRETTFIVEAFTRSKCYRQGTAQCASCHNPHPADPASNPVSLRFPSDPDRMCLQCHTAFAARIESHTHHAPSSDASRCISCHMPKIMNSLMFKARSHQIDDIPDAAMTARFGQEQSPNACLLCHQDRDAAWVLTQLARWRTTQHQVASN